MRGDARAHSHRELFDGAAVIHWQSDQANQLERGPESIKGAARRSGPSRLPERSLAAREQAHVLAAGAGRLRRVARARRFRQ